MKRTALVTLAAVGTLAGCAGGIGSTLTFHDTQTTKIDKIVLDGGSGDVQIRTVPGTSTVITRTVRSASDPAQSYTISGTELYLSGDCGHDCSVSYAIEAPVGVAVTGSLTSGSLALTGIATADVRANSGDIDIRNATGKVVAETDSGEVLVADGKGPATLKATSGDITAQRMGAAVAATADSGNIDVQLTVPATVTAKASSGNVDVTVPAGPYRVTTTSGSGDEQVNGIVNDAKATNLLDLEASSGDVTVTATA